MELRAGARVGQGHALKTARTPVPPVTLPLRSPWSLLSSAPALQATAEPLKLRMAATRMQVGCEVPQMLEGAAQCGLELRPLSLRLQSHADF